MKLKDWVTVPWREVEGGEHVRTADGRTWDVTGPWNGTHVMLHPVPRSTGVPVAAPLTDGEKQVEVLRKRPAETPTEQAVARFGAADPVTGTRSAVMPVPDVPLHPFEDLGDGSCMFGFVDGPLAGTVCTQPVWHAWHDSPDDSLHAAAVRDTVADADASRPKFGQPAADLTAAETRSTEPADDEGRAVAELARHGLAPELVSVKEAGKVLVPRELDDLALRSHLFLMHGHLDQSQDVDRAKLSELHGNMHESKCAHTHVKRSELPA